MLQFTPNPRASGNLALSANARARMSSIVSLDWDNITGKPNGALSKVDDTNVTMSLSGGYTAALLDDVTITVGWTGTLATSRGGLGANAGASSGVPLFASGTVTFTGTTGTGNFARATSPTFVTPILGTPTSGNLANCTNLPVSGLGSQAAYSLVGNFTGSPASPSALAISSLTQKTTPAGTDLIMLQDQSASGQLKYADINSLGLVFTTPEKFGATGDGVTDDTTALQLFLNACGNSNVIGVFKPGKTYMFGTQGAGLFVKSGSHLIGYGATLKALTTTLLNYSSLNITGPGQGSDAGPSFVTIEGLTLNGNMPARRTASIRTVTMTIASPAVASLASHGFTANTPIVFNTSGSLPTGVTADTVYYVIAAGLTSGAFQFSATLGGAAVNTSGSQSGTHGVTNFVIGGAASFYCVNATHVSIRDCTSIDSEGDGFYFGGSSLTGGPGYYFQFDGCYATGCSRNGYSIVGGNRGALVNCIAAAVSYGAAHGNISNGFDFEPDAATSANDAVDLIGCKAIACAEGFGVHNTSSFTTNVNWISCMAESCTIGFASGNTAPNVRIFNARTSANGTDFSNIGSWLGYTTGDGGVVTQATNKSTNVTLNKGCGAITMNGAALAAGTIVSFSLVNNLIAAGDVLVLNHISAGTVGSYGLNARCVAGSATIDVRNNTAGSLSEAIVIQFGLVKAGSS